MTYNGAHDLLQSERGSAKGHTCGCGKPAQEWAYLHNGDPELLDRQGRPWSWDIWNCYSAMCCSCHKKFDFPYLSAETREKLSRPKVYEHTPELRALRAKAARVANAQRRECECGRVAHPAAMGRHTKASGHSLLSP